MFIFCFKDGEEASFLPTGGRTSVTEDTYRVLENEEASSHTGLIAGLAAMGLLVAALLAGITLFLYKTLACLVLYYLIEYPTKHNSFKTW